MKLRHRILSGVAIVLGLGVGALAVALSYDSPCERPPAPAADMAQMKAVIARCYGPPETLQVEVVAKPEPAADQVLVRVVAAAVNPLDWHFMRGEPRFMRLGIGMGAPKDARMGVDFAGVVAAVGANVTRFKVGDEVFGGGDGSFAEYVLVRADRGIAHKPSNVSFEQAAGVGIAAVTAVQALRDAGELQPGQHVLINGASGGVGTFAVQMAKAMGARVTGVCSTRNVELVRSLGADHVIDYTKDNFTEHDVEYDLIIDTASSQPLSAMRRVLTHDGRLIIVGGVSREPWLGPMTTWIKATLYSPFIDQALLKFYASLRQTDLEQTGAWMRDGKVTPVIDRRFPLQEVAAAIAYVETGRARGKVIIEIP